jgi:Lrp/AsnC family leucine-responsive transcriptional regulator
MIDHILSKSEFATLRALQGNARLTWSQLGARLKMSAQGAAERVRRLEERGVIRGYQPVIDAAAVGVKFAAFILVTLEHPRYRSAFLRFVQSCPEIMECHHIAGDDDYILKVRCQDTAGLETIITKGLKGRRGVARTRTTIVLATEKETASLPLK